MSPSTSLEFSTFGSDLTRLELHARGPKRMMVGYASAFDFPIPGDNGETIYIRQGAFKKTLRENRENIQVLYHHGFDAQIGSKPLGVPVLMEEQKRGLWTETELSDTEYNRETIIPLLESGALRSMSIGHIPMERVWSDDRSEVEYRQIMLGEYGPTPFPRNLGATAAVHSGTVALLEELVHWSGSAALRTCSSAAEFRQIAFERDNDSDPDTAAHWTLPHHPRPGAGPDAAGVSAALAALSGARGGAPSLKMSVESVRNHLTRHQGEADSSELGGRDTTAEADRITGAVKLGRTIEGWEHSIAREAEWIRTFGG